MKKPSPSQQAKTSPSITSVLKVISDEKALVLFNNIVVSDNNNDGLVSLKEINLSPKQYYTRLSGLLNAGLIKRHKGKYSLTLLGKVVYDSQMVIGKALTYYWKLKAIESVEMSSDDRLPKEELTQLINALIDNHFIKDILIKEPLSYTFEDHQRHQLQQRKEAKLIENYNPL
jgi:predicted transcriptional regulator